LSVPVSENVSAVEKLAVNQVTIGGSILKQQDLTQKDI